ncbi:hypothetical protein OSTOST_01134 [Ostertagia ostertagi]
MLPAIERVETYDTSEDVDVGKKLAEDEGDSIGGYSSSRYGKYSSRYASATDETGSDDYIGKRESKYSSSYRSTDTDLQLVPEDAEQYGGDEEDTAVQEGDEGEEAEEGEEETVRSHTSSVSSSALAAATGAHAEQIEQEKPKRQIEQKVSFRASTDNSEPRVAKNPIENIVPKKKVSDLIARFNTGNVTNGRGEAWKEKVPFISCSGFEKSDQLTSNRPGA